jgi:hypothetical protein
VTGKMIIEKALDLTYKMGTFDMNADLKANYKKNLEGIKNLARQLRISTLSPKEKIQQEKAAAERKLSDLQYVVYFRNELEAANREMATIKEWKFLRSQSDREYQIRNQENKIRQLKNKSEQEKANQIKLQKKRISDLQIKLEQTEY